MFMSRWAERVQRCRRIRPRHSRCSYRQYIWPRSTDRAVRWRTAWVRRRPRPSAGIFDGGRRGFGFGLARHIDISCISFDIGSRAQPTAAEIARSRQAQGGGRAPYVDIPDRGGTAAGAERLTKEIQIRARPAAAQRCQRPAAAGYRYFQFRRTSGDGRSRIHRTAEARLRMILPGVNVTFDRDFARFPGQRWRLPGER
jgi:hypothetical protein